MSKKNLNNKNHIKEAERLYKKGYSVININIYEESGKKSFNTPKNCTELTYEECSKFIGETIEICGKNGTFNVKTNGIMLLTGIRKGKRKDIKHCICIDVDYPKDDEQNGNNFIKRYSNLFTESYIEETANGGFHYIFEFDPKDYDFVKNNKRFIYDDIKYSIDILGNSRKCVIAPSQYTTSNECKKYMAINKFDDIKFISNELFNMLGFSLYNKESKEINNKTKYNIEEYNITSDDNKDSIFIKVMLKNNIFSKFSGYEEWIKLGMIIKNENIPNSFELYHMICKQYQSGYKNEEDCRKYFNELKRQYDRKLVKMPTLIYLIKEKISSHEYNNIYREYEKILFKNKINIDIIKMNDVDNFKFDEKYIDSFDTNYFNSLDIYEYRKRYFETFVCKVLRPDGLYMYSEIDSTGINKLPYSESSIHSTFKHLQIDKNNYDNKSNSFIKKWIVDQNIRVSNEIIFDPFNGISDISYSKNSKTYNMFNGYSKDIKTNIDNVNSDTMLKPFKDILLNLVGNDQDNYNYMINYLAHLIQKPEENIPISILIKGNEGTGKNTILNAIRNIIGKCHYISSSKPTDFFGEHAEGFFRKLLVNLNEAEGKSTFDYDSMIKEYISEEYLTVNPKNVRPLTFKNYVRLIITSNKSNPIKLDIKTGARRWVIFESTDKYIDKKIYGSNFWSQVIKRFSSKEFIACLYKYLNEINISTWKFHEKPITKAFKDMAFRNIPDHIKFVEQYINKIIYDKKTCFIDEKINNSNHKISVNKFFDSYISYLSRANPQIVNSISLKKFSCDISEDKDLQFTKKREGSGNYYYFVPSKVIESLKNKNLLEDSSFDIEHEENDNKDLDNFFD